jgi:hypothetical protein
LFEEEQRFLFQAKTTLLVAVDDVESVLPPVVVDIVAFEGLGGKGLLVQGFVLQWHGAASQRGDVP